MDGVAEAEFVVGQNFPSEGVDRDVLRSRKEGEQGGQP